MESTHCVLSEEIKRHVQPMQFRSSVLIYKVKYTRNEAIVYIQIRGVCREDISLHGRGKSNQRRAIYILSRWEENLIGKCHVRVLTSIGPAINAAVKMRLSQHTCLEVCFLVNSR